VLVTKNADGVPVGALGHVARLRRCDDGAWVALDARSLNEAAHPFPPDDEHRSRHVLAFPEDCCHGADDLDATIRFTRPTHENAKCDQCRRALAGPSVAIMVTRYDVGHVVSADGRPELWRCVACWDERS
jgi:hypothetical protein